VGDRLFLRFVPADGGAILGDTLGCLKLIDCAQETPRHVAAPLLQDVYEAWNRAREDIHAEWTFATDPANLQPRVRPLFRQIADHLGRYPPPGLDQLEIDRTVDAIAAPWGMRIEQQLREAFRSDELDPRAQSLRVIEKVRELGLEPFAAPDVLPPIELDDVQLICWMLVEATS
jgi:hypothetical protein